MILIPRCLARATRAGASPREVPATRAAAARHPQSQPASALIVRPLSALALGELIDRKPDLLKPLAAQLLPPPIAPPDPAERLGIDLSSLRTAEDLRQALSTVLAAVSHGEIGPAEAAHVARRVRARWRSVRRLARLERRVTHETNRLR